MARTDRPKVRLNRKTVSKMAKGKAVYGMVTDAARLVADKVEGDAYVSRYTTDRRAASVTVPAEDQARDGALTRACAAVGLPFKAK